jgi:hypothetical protein
VNPYPDSAKWRLTVEIWAVCVRHIRLEIETEIGIAKWSKKKSEKESENAIEKRNANEIETGIETNLVIVLVLLKGQPPPPPTKRVLPRLL